MSETSEASDRSDATAPTDAPAPTGPAATPPPEPGPTGRPNGRKVREGVVASASMDKTLVVRVIDRVRHTRYAKTVQRTKRLYVHDGANDARVGDRVRVQETRPLSKQKRWRLVDVLERAK